MNENTTAKDMLYADYNASAPLCPTVKEFLKERLETQDFANPNAGHGLGRKLNQSIERVRKTIAEAINCQTSQVIFNSGSSEAIANCFFSIFIDEIVPVKKKIYISSIEHSATIDNAKYYAEKFNQELVYLPMNKNGETDLNFLKEALEKDATDVTLVTVMAANNETGVIQPYKEIAKLCNQYNIPFLSDTTQLIGKVPFDFEDSGIDYAMASGHKFGSLLGSGFLLVKDPKKITAMVKGGGQEKGMRCGTQNYLAIESLEFPLKNFPNLFSHLSKLESARNNFERKIKESNEGIMIFGEDANRVPTTTYMAKKGTIGQQIREKLESKGVYITTSSACSDTSANVSRVLSAMEIPGDYAAGALRISLCLSCDPSEYDTIYDILQECLNS